MNASLISHDGVVVGHRCQSRLWSLDVHSLLKWLIRVGNVGHHRTIGGHNFATQLHRQERLQRVRRPDLNALREAAHRHIARIE